MEKERDIEEYWGNKAEEMGEAIVMRSISHTYYRGITDTFGILYASENYLVYEYSSKGRKSILESLFSRRGGEELSESVQIPRNQIRRAVIVNSSAARSWVRRSLQPREVLEKLEKMHPAPLLNILAGTVVCVCTDTDYIVLDTPANRQWSALLQG
jgi:hypothetical protein